ncbi:MAG: hypothetical protein ACREEM_16130 [Blastocatellia bacterium]
METKIAIPDDLFQRASNLAQDIHWSFDGLVRVALNDYLDTYPKSEITRQLNELYEHVDSSLDPVLMQMQMTALDPEDWSAEWEEWKKRKDEIPRQ